MKKSLFLLFNLGLLSIICRPIQAQMFSNQGSLVSVKGGFVSIQGDAINDNGGTFHNTDTIYLTGDWTNQANNEAFISTTSGKVRMIGDEQHIKGNSVTRFYDLSLEGTNIKYGDLDVYVNGQLDLNDRELYADTNTIHVFDTDLAAVTHNLGGSGNWGFVSNLEDGGLLRYTDSDQAYFYPVGSAQGTARFRPVSLRPSSTNSNAYKVRMANVDASTEFYNRDSTVFDLCGLNPNFYHRISQTQGTDSATISIYYHIVEDSVYNHIAHWNTEWTLGMDATTAYDATYNLDVMNANVAWDLFNPNPFILARRAPEFQITAVPNPMCSDDTLAITAPDGIYTIYDYFIDSNLVAMGNSNTDPNYYTYNTTLTAGQHTAWVVGNYYEGSKVCGHVSDTVSITVYPEVNATISPDTIIVEGSAAFLYASGGDFYEWTPDLNLDCSICPQTNANPPQTTVYTVLVENMDGCTDTDSVEVTVQPDAASVVFIPNALTPNADGKNDTWFIKNIELFPTNRVKILNRWGDIVYESEYYDNTWDGQFGGGPLPAGTYYYILDLGDDWGIFKGPLTIVRAID
ncbi:MAG: gliding motility-associated C-terminal domain-containing protein [Saprospiraceae bacterium]|nr:gliding motility-associated C-terminal domain-containing protein [Saprospiraceae bacterium]